MSQPEVPTAWEDLQRRIQPKLRRKLQNFRCGIPCLKASILKTFPVLDWISHYDVKKSLPGDLVGGFTVGIMNIPQGMAYGALAGAEPIYGFIFCTSRHAAIGTFAIVSLMTGGIVNSVGKELLSGNMKFGGPETMYNRSQMFANATDSLADEVPLAIRLQVMQALTFAVGFWLLLMGIFRLGHLEVFLSDHLVRGFTCAAAFHVFTVQLKTVLGLKLPERHGALKLVFVYFDFFSNIQNVHIPTLIVSLICITILYLTRVFINGNPKVMRIIRIPVPIELLVIIFGTVASYYLDLDKQWNVKTVRDIPTGLPLPQAPVWTIIPKVLTRSFSLAVVAAAVLISLGKIFASKHHYKIDPNQELFAVGLANIFGAFFLCIPATGALARSTVQEAVGGMTQLVSFISAGIVLIVLLSVGKFLQPLPRACLGSIIMVALINLLKQVLDLKILWRLSLIDASIFFVTMVATLLLDVDLGLAVGVVYSLLTFAFRMQYGKVSVFGGTTGFVDSKTSPMIEELPGVRIVKLHGPLYSGNAESFVSKIKPFLETAPETTKSTDLVINNPSSVSPIEKDPKALIFRDNEVDQISETSRLAEGRLRGIILDFGAVNFVDVVGVKHLKVLAKSCKDAAVLLVIAGCSDDVRDFLYRAEIPTVIPISRFTRSVGDALDLLSVAV